MIRNRFNRKGSFAAPAVCGTATACACVMAIFMVAAAMSVRAQLVSFESHSVEEGLLQSTVFAVAEDSTGFLWLGTQDGLNHWDGHPFTSFHHDAADSTSLPDSWISALEVGADGRLFVGTRTGGLSVLEPGKTAFRRLPTGLLPHRAVTDMAQGADKRLWVATYGGLVSFHPDSVSFASPAGSGLSPHSGRSKPPHFRRAAS